MSIMIDHEENAPCMNPVEFGFFYLISDNFTHFFFGGVKNYIILEPQMIMFKYTGKNNEYTQIITSFPFNHPKINFF